MLRTRLTLAAALVLSMSASASAATLHATGVTVWRGDGVTGPRADAMRALGAPDKRFLSLGLGGAAVFSFGQAFTGPVSILETTTGNRRTYVETARVFVAERFAAGSGAFDASAFREIGSITNVTGEALLSVTGAWRYLAILDTSPRRPGRDGFDIESISVQSVPVSAQITPVPLPAAAPLLALGLAGFAMAAGLRRRARR